MALEDLTGPSKFIDDLVATNPLTGGERPEGAGHIRGIKNVIENSFPNIAGPMTASPAELNVLAGKSAIPAGLESGTIVAFYMAAAPTGWTQDTTTSNLDGSTMRVETGTAGGAVAGMHDMNAAPDPNHTHGETYAAASHAVTEAEMPAHEHLWHYSGATSTSSPDISSSDTGIYRENNNTGSSNRKYEMNGASLTPSVGPSGPVGSDATHSHTASGAITATTTLVAFAPKYINVIIAEKD
jgi:hypothetical protein